MDAALTFAKTLEVCGDDLQAKPDARYVGGQSCRSVPISRAGSAPATH
jgi:hypothetical protein